MRSERNVSWALALCVAVCVATVCESAGGCGAARPAKYYQLTVPGDAVSSDDPKAFPVTLLLGPLTAPHLYREDKIVFSSGGETMGTYEYQRWEEPPTEMMQQVLFRTLEASGKYRSVNPLRSGGHGDYVLHGRLYDFKEVSANGLSARVAVEYELRDTKTGNTVWSHYYSHDEPVSGKDVSAVVAAMDRSAQGAVRDVKAALEQYFSTHPVATQSATPAQ